MTRLLLAVDGSAASDRAVQYAIDLARRLPATEIVVANVQLRIPTNARVARVVTQAMIDDFQRKHAEEATASARRLLTAAGIRHEVEMRLGHVVQTILELARERDCQRIVMGTRGTGAAATLVLGSVARQVATYATVPVTLLR